MINNTDEQYKKLINKILETGNVKRDRTGVGTKSLFGEQLVYDLSEGFPILTLRRIHLRSVIHELLWFLGAYDQNKWGIFGNTNIRYLLDNGVSFWTEWPYQKYLKMMKYRPELPHLNIKEFEEKIKIDDEFALEFGSIGKGYGKQWLDFGGETPEKTGVNQITQIMELLKKDPDSRRIMLNSWNPTDINSMLLPPCHYGFQLYTNKINHSERIKLFSNSNKEILTPDTMELFPERRISMILNQRSCDLYLGNPFNVAEYALLLHMIASVSNMIPDKLIVNLGDVHLYNNSIDAANQLLKRDSYPLPILKLNENIKNIYDFRYEDIIIDNYKYHPNIHVDVAV